MKNKAKKIAKPIEWYRLSAEETLENLNSSYKGLTSEEASERLYKFGKNMLPVKKRPSLLKIIFNQLLNPLIYILIAAGGVSFFIGDIKDGFFIFLVILINTAIGAYQEWKAEKSSESLRNLLKISVKINRDHESGYLNAECLVPGDVVHLTSGGKVPADIRILKQSGLMADESLLTGESNDVIKISDKIEEEIPLSERENMLYAGSIVTTGRGLGVVVRTGMNTEIGQIAGAVTFLESSKPPLIKRMEKFSAEISMIVLFTCALIALIEFLRGSTLIEVFFLAVALAVSSIPEGLPASLTVALSVGMSRMAKRNVIIRKLPAVEGLGSCTLIASDKTGTLTVNVQTVKMLYLPDGSRFFVSGEGYAGEGEISPCRQKYSVSDVENLVKCAATCNEGFLVKKQKKWTYHGDAVDVALLSLCYKYGLNPKKIEKEIKVLKEIPFESERKFSAKFYKEEDDKEVKVAIKGAFEVILGFCTYMKTNEGIKKINGKRVERQAERLSGTGHRVIALAEGKINKKSDHDYFEADLKGLTFLGLAGLIDPLRPEAKLAVDKCKKAGIKVIMITGDHPETSFNIGKNLDIITTREQVVEGATLASIDKNSGQFSEIVNKSTIFARVTPLQKLDIVEALSSSGNFIAVTGDGVNDAPALKKAHIGVAMGSGTDVAKDVASMIIVDDNFASVVAGVEEGRYAYDNIRKVVYLLVATGAAEIVLFLLSIIFNLPIPLTAVQLLWLNLVTNGIQGVALAFEKGEKETMEHPPRRPEESIFNRLMIQEILISGISMGLIAFVLWVWLLSNGTPEYFARNIILLLMVLFENIHVFNCRSEYKSILKVPLRNNTLLITGVLAAQALHIISMNIPVMQLVLGIETVKIIEWVYLLVLSSSILVIMEIFKLLKFHSPFRKNRHINSGK